MSMVPRRSFASVFSLILQYRISCVKGRKANADANCRKRKNTNASACAIIVFADEPEQSCVIMTYDVSVVHVMKRFQFSLSLARTGYYLSTFIVSTQLTSFVKVNFRK